MRQNLKDARKSMGYTQEHVADLLHITPRYYQFIECGRNTGNVKLWDAMEDIFGINQRVLRSEL